MTDDLATSFKRVEALLGEQPILNLGKLQQISKLWIDDLSDGTALLRPKLEFELGALLAHLSPHRIVNDDGATIG
jgi:hypothetical protein